MAELRVKETGTLKLFESDNTSSVTIASPASLGADRTITLPDGDVTLVAGTMSTGGVSLATSTNNQIVTVTGADAITGETNFIYNGTIVGAGADGANADLGSGIHIKTGDSGLGSVGANYDELIIEGSGRVGMNFLSPAGNKQDIAFSDADADAIGGIVYDHSNNTMGIATNNAERIRIGSDGDIGIGTASPTSKLTVEKDSTTSWICHLENTAGSNYGRVLQLNLDNDFDDNASVFCIAYGAATERFKVFSSGDVENHDNSYGGISDERVKQDIRDANSQWDDIKALKVRNFKRKDDVRQYGENAWEQIGVVAQEAELVSPKLVKESLPSSGDILSDSAFGALYTEQDKTDGIIPEDKNVGDIKTTTDEKVKGMKYSVLYMKAIKALQESMERIETLEAKVTALENA